jgi:hypothetical protein
MGRWGVTSAGVVPVSERGLADAHLDGRRWAALIDRCDSHKPVRGRYAGKARRHVELNRISPSRTESGLSRIRRIAGFAPAAARIRPSQDH